MQEILLDLTQPQNIIEVQEDSHVIGKILCSGNEVIHTNLLVIHNLPNKRSKIDIKVVVKDRSKFDITGLLKINKGASGTNTYLKIDCLMLDEGSYAKAVPSLEINESAVKAGHGATIGKVDENMLFYLKSKGFEKREVEKLLVDAFLEVDSID